MVARTVTKIIDIFQTNGSSVVGSTTGLDYSIGIPTSGSSVTWTSPNTWTTSDSYSISPSIVAGKTGTLSLQGENADIEINGKSLVAMLERIEQRINLLTVNAELEAEWDELRELGDQYRALEQRIKDKMETWSKLQAQDKDNR